MEKIVQACILVSLITCQLGVAGAYSSARSSISIDAYAIPDQTGRAILDQYNALLVTSSSTQALGISIESGATMPILDVTAFCDANGVILPAIQVHAHSAYSVTMQIATGTEAITTDIPWDCMIGLPTQTTVQLQDNYTLSKAIEIGSTTTRLSFDIPIKITIPGEAGKRVGYSRSNDHVNEISETCDSRTNLSRIVNQLKENKYYCTIESGNDVIIWSKRSAKFATYSRTRRPDIQQNSSVGGSGTVPSSLLTFLPLPTPVTFTFPVTSFSPNLPATTPVAPQNEAPVTVSMPTTETSSVTPDTTNLPDQLFDIALTIEDAQIASSSELIAQIQFTSFGTVPTPVDITYQIKDSQGMILFSDYGSTTVETEKTLRKSFDNIFLSDGKYTLLLITNYADNVSDEFSQEFQVVQAREEGMGINILYTVGGLVGVMIVIPGTYLAIRTARRRKIHDLNI